jgi:hypothetical protein
MLTWSQLSIKAAGSFALSPFHATSFDKSPQHINNAEDGGGELVLQLELTSALGKTSSFHLSHLEDSHLYFRKNGTSKIYKRQSGLVKKYRTVGLDNHNWIGTQLVWYKWLLYNWFYLMMNKPIGNFTTIMRQLDMLKFELGNK